MLLNRKNIAITLVMVLVLSLLSGCSDQNNTPTDSSKNTEASGQSADSGSVEPVRNAPSTGSLAFQLIGEDGNNEDYDISQVAPIENSPLKGKVFYWLGSSVTDGFKSKSQSMADFIAARNQMESVKEALSGTTLSSNGDSASYSYVGRLTRETTKLDPSRQIDAFICQISTNDVNSQNLANLGTLPESADYVPLDSIDITKTLDSVQYIIEYVHDTWDCPIYFYSGAYFGDANTGVRGDEDPLGSDYAKLVADVQTMADEWNAKDGYTVKVIDMYNDEAFNQSVSDSDYDYLMHDPVHPYKAGYLLWWTPYFEKVFYEDFAQ